MKRCVFLYFGMFAWAQIHPPGLGWMVDGAGAARPVQGIAGSVVVGDAAVTGVVSSGCSKLVCLAKTDAWVVSLTGSVAAPEGPALFAFEGATALIYFPRSKQFARWQQDQLEPVSFHVAGEVLSISLNQLAVRRDSSTWIVRGDDTEVYALPRAAGPVLLIGGGVIYATAEAVVVRRDDASEIQFPLVGARSFSRLGAGYAQIRAGGASYCLRTDRGHEQLFQLPEVSGQ
jgi:hypothetical protein